MDKWISVSTPDAGYLSKMKVTGGWIYKQVEDVPVDYGSGQGLVAGHYFTSSICFVPFLEAKCETCEGRGWVITNHNHWGTDPCPTCNGSGK